MVICKKDIQYTSKLAKLVFKQKEEKKLINDLNKILDNMKKLNELRTEHIGITINPYYVENQFREDEVQESLLLNEVLQNTQNYKDEYIVVPKIID